jgi:hypothetical protein
MCTSALASSLPPSLLLSFGWQKSLISEALCPELPGWERALLMTQWLYEFLVCTVTNFHKLGDLRQQEVTL